MSLGFLISILNDCLKDTSIRCHNSWLENNLHIVVFMRWNLDFFRINFKSKLFNSVGCFLANIEFDITSNFVTVLDFYFFHDPFRYFWWNQSTEIENTLFNEKYIWFYYICYICWMMLTWQDQLFFEYRLEATSVYSRDTWLSNKLVQYSVWFIIWISVLDINSYFLFKELLSVSGKFYLDCNAAIWANCSTCWSDSPLTNF